MARKPATKTRKQLQPSYALQAIVLSRFDVLQYLNVADQDKAKLALDCFIAPVGEAENTEDEGISLYYGSVCFRCSREGEKDLTTVRMAAMYSFAFTCTSDDQHYLDHVSRLLASTNVWAQFMNMFGLANTQMRSRMPLLPPDPGNFEVRSLEDLVDVFSVFGRDGDTSIAKA